MNALESVIGDQQHQRNLNAFGPNIRRRQTRPAEVFSWGYQALTQTKFCRKCAQNKFSLEFCGKSKKNDGVLTPATNAFRMYGQQCSGGKPENMPIAIYSVCKRGERAGDAAASENNSITFRL